MEHDVRREAKSTRRKAGLLRTSVAQLAVLGLVAGGALAALSVSASAVPAPPPAPTCDTIGTSGYNHYVLVCKSGPETAVAGTDITYTLDTYSTTHKYDDHEFLVTDSLPEGTTLVSVDGGSAWDCTGEAGDTEISCTNTGDGSDINGETITVVVHVDSDFSGTSIENCGTLSLDLKELSVEGGSVYPSESCWETEITRESDLSIVKTIVSPTSGTLTVPGSVEYTITVTNNGPSDSDEISVTDKSPGTGTFTSVAGTGWSCSGSNSFQTCTHDPLAAGDSASIDVKVEILATQVGITLTNCASVIGGDPSGATSSADNPNQSCATIEGTNIKVEAASVVAPTPVTAAARFTG
jgi:uncharacterized repeat protein (TIGR01451 family)